MQTLQNNFAQLASSRDKQYVCNARFTWDVDLQYQILKLFIFTICGVTLRVFFKVVHNSSKYFYIYRCYILQFNVYGKRFKVKTLKSIGV